MIVTKNTFVSYSLARSTAQFQLVLLILSLFTTFGLPGDLPQANLNGLSVGTFYMYTHLLIPLLVASLLLLNLFTDILGFESMKYWASIMGLCLLFMLFAVVVSCYTAIVIDSIDKVFETTAYNYLYWLKILEVSIVGQIVSGVIFLMIRGLVRTKVQLKTIPEKTKCLLETDALTANKDEINLFSSFMIPCLVLILIRINYGFGELW